DVPRAHERMVLRGVTARSAPEVRPVGSFRSPGDGIGVDAENHGKPRDGPLAAPCDVALLAAAHCVRDVHFSVGSWLPAVHAVPEEKSPAYGIELVNAIVRTSFRETVAPGPLLELGIRAHFDGLQRLRAGIETQAGAFEVDRVI